jgi:tetraacyldisaccharide 4'-kinase
LQPKALANLGRASLQHWVHRRWYQTPSPSTPNALDQFINQRLTARRAAQLQLNRQQKPPVVVIGNLVAGGGGKSPTVAYLAEALQATGKKVALLTSGYGGTATHARQVSGQDDPALQGDEGIMLARTTGAPVFSGRNRLQAYSLAVAKCAPDIVLSDDGLQHFELPRALQIVCLDERLFGNQRPLPFGPLREPISTLEQVDAIVIPEEVQATTLHRQQFIAATKANHLSRLNDNLTFDLAKQNQPDNALVAVRGTGRNSEKIYLVAGIANPARFEHLVQQIWPTLPTQLIALADHEFPAAAQLNLLSDKVVFMTEKDAVKWHPAAENLGLKPKHWWVLSIKRSIEPDLGRFVLEQLV